MQQLHYILLLVAVGALMGTVFDIYNTVTGASKWLKWLRPTLDVIYWLASAFFVFYCTFITDDGRFRIYTFLLLLLGYGIYYATLRRTVIGSAFLVVRFVARILRFAYRVVYSVTWWPLSKVLWIVWTIAKKLYRILIGIENGFFWGIGLVFKGIVRPFVRPWRRIIPLEEIDKVWQGMWNRMSKWIKKDPERI